MLSNDGIIITSNLTKDAMTKLEPYFAFTSIGLELEELIDLFPDCSIHFERLPQCGLAVIRKKDCKKPGDKCKWRIKIVQELGRLDHISASCIVNWKQGNDADCYEDFIRTLEKLEFMVDFHFDSLMERKRRNDFHYKTTASVCVE
ncbi:hypothetical protein GCM10020331_084730 [Ectobacillus funiculus]